jgi:sulfur-carrier protein
LARLSFTKNLERHVACPPETVDGDTLRAVLEAYLGLHPALRSYLLDEQGELRKHVVIFVDGRQLADRRGLTDVVGPSSEVCVMQALSGG